MAEESDKSKQENVTSNRKVVLTCAQPTGGLHLGNYLGAIRNWVSLSSQENECYFGIVDMHAITTPYVPADLRKSTLSCVAQYIACGLDPKQCNIFVQSQVMGHAELSWVLGCLTPIGRLQRMTQFKDKSGKAGAEVGAGLLYYPVLMAADILLYNADIVPVGHDQKQHLELTRDLAEKFNHTYSPTFTVPEPYMSETGARIMSLQDPCKKMSKSDKNMGATLFLIDSPDVLRKKVMSAVTDTGREIIAREDKPGVTNLLHILSAATGKTIVELEAEHAGKGYGDFKKVVADAVIAVVDPIREEYNRLMDDKKYLEGVLADGASAAQKRAYKLMAKVYKKVGFVPRAR